MNSIEIKNNSIVIVGAGKIGRSFIGQLFGKAGYKITFIDVDPVLVNLINMNHEYRIIVKDKVVEEIKVSNVDAICLTEEQKAVTAISEAGILAVSVGKRAFKSVISLIASGLKKRFSSDPERPLDILIAENMINGSIITETYLKDIMPPEYPLNKLVGLIECCIGKMVPVMKTEDLEKDPLLIYAEAYNTLILDAEGFKSKIPDVKGLSPKSNIKAWIDRKAFIHNLGHATAAYYGYYSHPDSLYLYEVLDDKRVFCFTREVMVQSAYILAKIYPDDFTGKDITEHIDDLLSRFKNKHLKDTLLRVGQDLTRKLNHDDRFMGVIRLAKKIGAPYNKILEAMSYGLFFKAKNEDGSTNPDDEIFIDKLSINFHDTLVEELSFDPLLNTKEMFQLADLFLKLKRNPN